MLKDLSLNPSEGKPIVRKSVLGCAAIGRLQRSAADVGFAFSAA
jgi:hypothetical protein